MLRIPDWFGGNVVTQDFRIVSLLRGTGLLLLLGLTLLAERQKLPTVRIERPISAQPRESNSEI